MASGPIVHVKDGQLRGFLSKAEDDEARPVYNYLGIPFGKSTDGKRRFMPPERSETWTGIRDATKVQDLPPQNAEALDEAHSAAKNPLGVDFDRQSENSLHLNVFTPTAEETSQLPVMVWIAGGGYMRLKASAFDGTALSGMNNVVTVCPNYRVNALGFLSLGRKSKCPGNCGLRDIILALKWVQENINCFGGDPNNVTLFGESAGGGLCHLLTMSPLSKGLFHKVIASSGTPLSPFLFAEDISPISNTFLLSLGIKEKDSASILQKLQDTPIERILDAQKGYDSFNSFYPTVDGFVIEDAPGVLARTGKFHPLPLLLGVADSESGGILSLKSPPNYMDGSSLEDISSAMENFLHLSPLSVSDASSKAVVEALLERYWDSINHKDDKYKYSQLYAKISGDFVFVVPTVLAATSHAGMQNPAYLYLMTKRMEYSHSKENGPDIKKKLDYVNCDHGDILTYLWGDPFIKGDLRGGAWYTAEEREMSRVVMRYFTNFAKTGNPNDGLPVPHEWPSYQIESKRHLVLDTTCRVDQNLASDSQQILTEMFF